MMWRALRCPGNTPETDLVIKWLYCIARVALVLMLALPYHPSSFYTDTPPSTHHSPRASLVHLDPMKRGCNCTSLFFESFIVNLDSLQAV